MTQRSRDRSAAVMLRSVARGDEISDPVSPNGRLPVFARRSVADPGILRTLRGDLDVWLADLHWPEADRDDVVLAANEACTNVIEHAYTLGRPGDIAVVARLQVDGLQRRAILHVRDWGHWRARSAEPGYRGHGLAVMRGAMARVDIHHGADGTIVTMTSAAVPGLASATPRRVVRSPLRASAPTTISAAAVDRATADRRHRHATILRRASHLRARSGDLVAAATQARTRVQHTWQENSRVLADARHVHASARRRAHGGEPVAPR